MHLKKLIFLLIMISLVTVNPRINGWNEASRMATTQSLIEYGELNIDQSDFLITGDKVFINGKFYSDKPVTPSMLAALVYLPLYQIGVELDYNWNLAYYFIILVVIKSLWILSVLAFYRLMEHFNVPENRRLNHTLVYTFASQALTWSATFNNHSIAASSLLLGFAYYMFGKDKDTKKDLLLSGFFFGLAAASDLPTGLFLVGFGWLVLRSSIPSRRKWAFIIAGIIPLGFHLGMNYYIAGTFLPPQFTHEFMQYAGSHWQSGIQTNGPLLIIRNFLFSFVGPQGFIWYSPLVLILGSILVKQMRKDAELAAESMVIVISAVLLIFVYSTLTQNLGGWGYGMRWFVPLIPLLYVYQFRIDQMIKSKLQSRIYVGLVIYSGIIAVIGLINPWSNPEVHSIPIVANMLQLTQFLIN